jgi:putative oxidoreductase
MIAVMLVAALTVHWSHGLFAGTNGVEVPLLYATGAFGLALVGPGPFSLDAALGLTWTPAITFAALAVGVVGGLVNLAFRRLPETAVAR